MEKYEIKELLKKPLWQMIGEEYVALNTYARSINMEGRAEATQVTRLKGVHAVAEYCDCSDSQVTKLIREGALDTAIISRIGKSIVFDGDKARRCANDYQAQQRALRLGKKNNK